MQIQRELGAGMVGNDSLMHMHMHGALRLTRRAAGKVQKRWRRGPGGADSPAFIGPGEQLKKIMRPVREAPFRGVNDQHMLQVRQRIPQRRYLAGIE